MADDTKIDTMHGHGAGPQEAAADAAACEGCAVGRRTFLRDAAVALALLATITGGSASAATLPVRRGTARWLADEEVTYDVPEEDGAVVDRTWQVILVRWQGSLYAFALSCPHQRTALRWRESDGQFQCPKHHSRYQPDGTYISGRATRSMDRMALRLEGGRVVVDTGRVFHEDEDPTGWAGATVALPGTTPAGR